MTQSPALEDFTVRLAEGHLVNGGDPMPDDYRNTAARIAAFQVLAELVGVLPFQDWIGRAPGLVWKQMITAKVQDEVGQGHITARVAEDLGRSREAILESYAYGEAKLLNIFHYDFLTWGELPIAALLMNSAALVQFRSLSRGSYVPYVRALKKIMREESFHYHLALEGTEVLLREGTDSQRAQVQEGLTLWWPRVLGYFGPDDSATYQENIAWQLRLKMDNNETIRQAWISKIVPVLKKLRLEIPDEQLEFDEDAKRWSYTQPDWPEIKRIIKEDAGPASQRRRQQIRTAFERNAWARPVALVA
jgi:ring-1,2-phenylacetyl-CoA epoxidase subunit PaaA